MRSVLVSKPRELRDSLSLMPSSTACLPLTTFIRLQQQKHAEERCRRCVLPSVPPTYYIL